MILFFQENLGTIVVLAALAVVVALIIRKLVSDRRKGQTSCGCGCSGCPNSGLCHSPKK